MSDVSLKLARASKSEPPAKPKLSAQERNALKKLRREAKRTGATLTTDGGGGLPPSLVRAEAELQAAGRDFDRALRAFAELQNIAQDPLTTTQHGD